MFNSKFSVLMLNNQCLMVFINIYYKIIIVNYLLFHVHCLMFNVHCSLFNGQYLLFNIQYKTFNVHNSMFKIICYMVNVKCLNINGYFSMKDILNEYGNSSLVILLLSVYRESTSKKDASKQKCMLFYRHILVMYGECQHLLGSVFFHKCEG